MPRYPSQRLLIVLFAVCALLFQQLAMATYRCPLEDAESVISALDDGEPTAPPCHQDVEADKARCHEHCHPTVPSADHVAAVGFPPLLPPAMSEWTSVDPGSCLGLALGDGSARAHPPPIFIQYCSFQI